MTPDFIFAKIFRLNKSGNILNSTVQNCAKCIKKLNKEFKNITMAQNPEISAVNGIPKAAFET